MSERKVINKWLDPEFDPSKVVIEKKQPRSICNVRMMLPMTVLCLTCKNYMYLGTKFNMRVEAVADEDYLGIKIYRFYFKCTRCYGEVTFKTDPKNHDYVCEWGLKRKHQQWKDMALAEEEYKEKKAKEMKEDAMMSLEYKKQDTKIEMDILEAMDQVKSLNKSLGVLNVEDSILQIIQRKFDQAKDSEKDLISRQVEEEMIKTNVKKIFQNANEKRINDFLEPMLGEKRNAMQSKSPANLAQEKQKKEKASINEFISKNSFADYSSSSED